MSRFVQYRHATLALLLLTIADRAAAQQTVPAPGARVRLTLTASAAERFGAPQLDAPLRAAGGDSIALDATTAMGPVVVSTQDVTKFERHDGRKSNAGKGAGIGFGIGAMMGGITTFAFSMAGGECSNSLSDLACEDTAGVIGLAGAAAGGLLGLLVGAAAGSASSSDRWTSVDAPVAVMPAVVNGAPGIGMRVVF
jgi:hypothetical protein